MKNILIILTLAASLMATAQCPTEYKQNNGGGNCGSPYTGRITLTFSPALANINQAPKIISVSITKGGTPANLIWSQTPFFASGGGNTEVIYCYSSSGQSDNIFNGGNVLYFTLQYQNGTAVTTQTCVIGGGLPVTLTSFTAKRNGQNVEIKWTTATEQNNDHFNLQILNGTTWNSIQTIRSKAQNGNSDNVLNYSVSILNSNSSVSQYRLEQVDIDEKKQYSPIVNVIGYNQKNLTIYPNPSSNGFTLLLPDNKPRTIIINDASGRTLNKVDNAISTYKIDNLRKGIYTIQIKSGTEVQTQKVVVD